MEQLSIHIIDTIEQKKWDAGLPSFLQSYAWGESRTLVGQRILRLVIKHNTQPSIHLLVVLKQIPYTSWSMAYIFRAPYLEKNVLVALKKFGRKHSIATFVFEPHILKKDMPPCNLLTRNPYPSIAQWTPVIDLTQPYSEIERKFTKTVRNEIRYAEKNNGIIVHGQEQNLLEDFLFLFTSTHTRKHYTGYTQEYLTTVFNTLQKYNQIQIFVGYDQNSKPVSAACIVQFGDTLTYTYAGSLGNKTPRGMMYLLVASIIKYGQQYEYKTFDLFGAISPQFIGDHPWKGFTQFKKSFGPVFIEYAGAYNLVIHRPLHVLYVVIKMITKNISKFSARLSNI
jgi:lipid II:glycine glycyltransferase (peptidoglycan interpeptide bridge formation enzyme)